MTQFLVFQAENPNSIVSSIAQARENARMVRDQITAELWEELNRVYLFLHSPRAAQLWREAKPESLVVDEADKLELKPDDVIVVSGGAQGSPER